MVDQMFLNELISVIYPYIQEGKCQDVKMQLDIMLHDYNIKKASTELTVYSGTVNEKMLLRFLQAKLAKGCTARTIDYYKVTVKMILERIGKPYNEVTPDDIRYYLAYRVSRDGVTSTTAGNEYRALSAFYSWMRKEEILIKNPMDKVDPPKRAKLKKKAFTQIEIEKLRAGCRTKREQAIIEMMLSTWCRITELVNIKISDIHEGKCMVIGKGNKQRELYVNAKAQIAIDMYLKERKDKNPYLFPRMISIQNTIRTQGRKEYEWYMDPECVDPDKPCVQGSVGHIVKKIGERVGVANVHPHRFRRTGATMALRAGMPIIQVSKLMGHESVETTQIYLDISDEELEEAHTRYVI